MPRVKNTNQSQQLAALPAELSAALTPLITAARDQGCRLFLVGGAVRDIILKKPVRDADIVVLGEALALAKAVAPSLGKLTIYPAFGTATITLEHTRLDLSSARNESYAHPGALPTVRPGTLEDDLRRRDFTINTLAVSLNTDDYGLLIDYCGGEADLDAHLIRALHKNSFADDPTRIWRAGRYEQRLGFIIEPETLKWLKRDVAGLQNVTGDRIWYELLCLLQEEEPERVLVRLNGLGVIKQLSPTLRADNWLVSKFQTARAQEGPSVPLYLALLAYRLKASAAEAYADYLSLNKPLRRIIQDVQSLKAQLPRLRRPSIRPSTIYRKLCGYTPEALAASLIATASPTTQQNLTFFQQKLKDTRVSLAGNDLLSLGVPPGPRVGEILQRLLKARLDGQINSRAEEIALTKAILTR